MKFENFHEVSKDNNMDKKTILSKLRESKLNQTIIKTGAAAALLVGINNPVKAENNQNHHQNEKTEISKESINPKAESYDASRVIVGFSEKDLEISPAMYKEKVLSGMKISQLGLLEVYLEHIGHRIHETKEEIREVQNNLNMEKEASDLSEKENQLKDFENFYEEKIAEKVKIEQSDLELNDEQKKILENSENIFGIINKNKEEIINIINSSEYLKKLQTEFNCSREEAKAHQSTRVNNVQNIKLDLLAKEYLSKKYLCQAYYDYGNHSMALPYDIDDARLDRLTKHELWHVATMSDKGLSAKAKSLLTDFSIKSDNKYFFDKNDQAYATNSTERYVRLKILDSELERLGIKNVGDRFTKEHYNKMMQVFMDHFFEQKDNGEGFNTNAFDFILMTRDSLDENNSYLIYDRLFNEIAMDDQDKDSLKSNKDYHYSGWDYNDKENLA